MVDPVFTRHADVRAVLADSGHLTFGGPPRVCTGRDHALALAAGVVEGLWVW